MEKLSLAKNNIHELYLDYFNNFLSVDAFASWHCLTLKKAHQIIKLGRKINNNAKLK